MMEQWTVYMTHMIRPGVHGKAFAWEYKDGKYTGYIWATVGTELVEKGRYFWRLYCANALSADGEADPIAEGYADTFSGSKGRVRMALKADERACRR